MPFGQTTLTGTADEIGRRVGELAAEGITEIIYQPTGPDIPGELEAFHTAVRGCGTRPSRALVGIRSLSAMAQVTAKQSTPLLHL